MKVEYVSFHTRAARSEYIANRYRQCLRGKVLDVGCDEAVLKRLLPHLDYTGIDFAGAPDIILDLESADKLPFADREFECVICSDVLEHIDNLHGVFAELIRISARYVIISLPNCWANARRPIARGKGSFAHYGLPVHPPADRHRWFFSLSDGVVFIREHEKQGQFRVLQMHAGEKPRWFFVRACRRLRYPKQERYLNRYAHTLWVLLER